MDEKEEIGTIIEDAIAKEDHALLDVLWSFAYCMAGTSVGGYVKNGRRNDELIRTLSEACRRNLEKKYQLDYSTAREKTKIIGGIFPKLGFDSKTYYAEVGLIREILDNRTSNILVNNIKKKLEESDFNKKILSFVFNYISLRLLKPNTAYTLNFDPPNKNPEEDFISKECYFELRAKKGAEILNRFYREEIIKENISWG